MPPLTRVIDNFSVERLANAWRQTPTKWYPLPVAVGALLLIVLQYRRKAAEREVHVDEEGREVLKLKGPWHVRALILCSRYFS